VHGPLNSCAGRGSLNLDGRKDSNCNTLGPTVRKPRIVTEPPQFEFDEVGSTPQEIKTYYEGLAQADGVNLDELAKKTLSGE
jgi:hypothetical protein